jgi:hypothetical protein
MIDTLPIESVGLEHPLLSRITLHRHRDFEEFDQFVLAGPAPLSCAILT